jgi:2,4-dienoyl-CoA reductase-like NADH-dependent reductase (Old Yellow Enzyme family)
VGDDTYGKEPIQVETMSEGLFSPLKLRGVELKNRIGVSPMCQYSSDDGFANDWHFVHLGAFATGGAALVMTEATAVVAEGRISPADLGIWKDEHVPALRRITDFIHAHGALAGMQMAHAGRKASTRVPWAGDGAVPADEGGWENVMAPSAVPFNEHYPRPVALDEDGIHRVVDGFRDAARRALDAGFDVVEVHAAHGYLLHEFMSPLANERTDAYGGSFENRVRLVREVVAAVREVWPERLPLLVRISASDWAQGGWDIDDSARLAPLLREDGADLIDCSSGGLIPNAKIEVGPGYQVGFAERVRRDGGVPTAAVGLITDAQQADDIIRAGRADVVLLARELLRNPRWPLLAAHRLGVAADWPNQYSRARPR